MILYHPIFFILLYVWYRLETRPRSHPAYDAYMQASQELTDYHRANYAAKLQPTVSAIV